MSQPKTATIEDILNEKHWDGPNGRIYYSTLVLDNGERGEIGAKKQDAYSIGDSLTYTATHDERGTKFKKYFEPNGNGGGSAPPAQQGDFAPARSGKPFTGGGQRGSDASFALSYAKDFIGKAMEVRKSDEVSVNQWVEAVLTTAAKFNDFLKENNA
jgi:hypothetical protein